MPVIEPSRAAAILGRSEPGRPWRAVTAASLKQEHNALMEILGEIERTFATSLYPLRIPIAIGLAAAAIVLFVVARRRGWFAAARRHPGRSAVLIVAVLAIGLPSAWYLGSPLFIRTALIEPDPVAEVVARPTPQAPAPTTTPAGPGGSAGTPGASPTTLEATPAPTVAPTPFVPGSVASGTFKGEDDFHFGSGTASIIETAPGAYTLRFKDFSVRNGPDLFVYLSPDGKGYSPDALKLGKLKATDGSFGYALPAGTDPTTFASAVIWCKQFSVQFAVARLAPR